MPALFFPSADLLRRVLAGGLVPPTVAASPARARVDAAGRVWLEPAAPLPRQLLDALARVGVRERPPTEPPTEAARSWAEFVPGRPSTSRPSGVVLLELPAHRLAAVVRSVRRRTAGPVGVGLVPGDDSTRAWLTAPALPPGSPEGEAFAEAAPGVWVAVGWEHDLAHLLVPPPGGCLLVRPPRVVTAYHEPPPPPADREYPITGRAAGPTPAGRPPVIRQSLTLVHAATGRESLWVWPRDADGPFRAFCRTAGERELRGLDVAECGGRVIVRRAAGREAAPVPVPDPGYWPHPRAAGLFLPAGYDLRPAVRPNALARLLDLGPDRVTWVERGPDGRAAVFSVPAAAFRPLAAAVEYTAPAAVALGFDAAAGEPFALAPLPVPLPEVLPVAPEPRPAEPTGRAAPTDHPPSGLGRFLGRLAGRLLRPPAPPPKPTPASPKPLPDRPAREDRRTPDELVHGPAAVARRHRLEERLVAAGPGAGARHWADLAAAYRAAGMAEDAAVCWVNAGWEDRPPADWAEEWYRAECRAAGVAAGEPAPPTTPRLAAAAVCRAAARGERPADLSAVRAAHDAGADDLPARAAWLAAGALSRLVGGDPLGLARWRDRLLGRLDDRGPGLDLDAPSFLRFHGAADPDRFRAARGWLVRARRPVLAWVGRLAGPGKLQWAGLDPEVGCTSAYALLLLAWGLAAVGDRGRSRDWAARGHKALTRATAPGADPGVHAVLADALAARVREALEGRPARPGLPPAALARYDRLPEFARYAVDKFRRFSRVLEPADRVRDYGGREFGGLWGGDRLGDRLALLAGSTGTALDPDEARRLLAEAAADPAGDALPRVAFTLLELAPRLDPGVLPDLLAAVPPALDRVGRWVDAGRPAGEASGLRPAVLARLVENALTSAAGLTRPSAAGPVVADLVGRVGHDPDLGQALTRAAGPVFRSLRKLGHRAEAEALLEHLDPTRGGWPADAPLPPHRLGLAAGWFAVGEEEIGTRLLDDARGRLFVAREGDERGRTELAVAYAEALGGAPAGLALGRLDELFQRLGRVAVTGSTNRYYTLQPLRLIDRAVRAAVGDEFAPGPAARGWLAEDEYLTRRRIHRDMAAALRAAGGE